MLDLLSNKIASKTKDFGLIKMIQKWHLFENKIKENFIKFQQQKNIEIYE